MEVDLKGVKCMYIVKPFTWEALWGDQKLHAYGADPTKDKVGILFTVSGIEGIDCEIENKEEKTTLLTATKNYPEKFGLKEGEEYPLIIAFDSIAQDVSFQMHPTDAYARNRLNRLYGKAEAWYFLEPPTEGWTYAENVAGTKEAIEKAFETNDFINTLGRCPAEKEDIIYIPAGTVHAVTHGSLIYEIQQSTNITYRLYDYDRLDKNGNKRPLHKEQVLDNLIPDGKVYRDHFSMDKTLPYREFTLHRCVVEKEVYNESDIAMAISVVSGTLVVDGFKVEQGRSILVMPNEKIKLEGKAECIVAYAHAYWRNNL